MRVKERILQRELSGWTRGLRGRRPDGVEVVEALPLPEYYDVAIRSAIVAGWVVDAAGSVVTDEEMAGDLTFEEAAKLGNAIWDMYLKVTHVDPKLSEVP